MRGRVRVTEDPGGVKGLIRAQVRVTSSYPVCCLLPCLDSRSFAWAGPCGDNFLVLC